MRSFSGPVAIVSGNNVLALARRAESHAAAIGHAGGTYLLPADAA
jgi:hypothetical protein